MSNRKKYDSKDLELRLAKLDLSDQSRIKDSLRDELQKKIESSHRSAARYSRFIGKFTMFRKPLPGTTLRA